MQEPFSDDQTLLFLTRPRMVHVFCEHLSPVNESACNPKPKTVRQTGRYPFNAEHNDLANDSSFETPAADSKAGYLAIQACLSDSTVLVRLVLIFPADLKTLWK